MNFEEQKSKALEIAKAKGIREPKYNNPVFKTLWKIGIEIRPPHYLPFLQLVLIFSFVFSVLFTILVFLRFRQEPLVALELGALLGIILGLIIASLYQHDKKKFKLPDWEKIN